MKETNIKNIGRILKTEDVKWFTYSMFFEKKICAIDFLDIIKKIGFIKLLKNNGLYKQIGARSTKKTLINENIERYIILSYNSKEYANAIIEPTDIDVNVFLNSSEYARNEDAYLKIFEKVLADSCVIHRQYQVLEYRIDLYIPDLKIAIEFDESSHFSNSKKIKSDFERQLIIETELDCVFYRIDERQDVLPQIDTILKIITKKITGSDNIFNGRFITESCQDTILGFVKDFDLYFFERNLAAINKSSFGELTMYDKLKIQNIEEKMAFAIDMNYITSFDMLLAELRKMYKRLV